MAKTAAAVAAPETPFVDVPDALIVDQNAPLPKPEKAARAPRLKPRERRKRDVHVQNDVFVRKNLNSEAEILGTEKEYLVPQYIFGQDEDTGETGIVLNPEYEDTLDPIGKLKELPIGKPRVGKNGQNLPARYYVKTKAPTGTAQNPAEHRTVIIRQDN